QWTGALDERIGEADDRVRVSDRMRERRGRPVVEQTRRERDSVAPVPRKLQRRLRPGRMEEVDDLVEGRQVDADVLRPGGAKLRRLAGDRRDDAFEHARLRRVRDTLRGAAAECT